MTRVSMIAFLTLALLAAPLAAGAQQPDKPARLEMILHRSHSSHE
jgi:hypothetical protein